MNPLLKEFKNGKRVIRIKKARDTHRQICIYILDGVLWFSIQTLFFGSWKHTKVETITYKQLKNHLKRVAGQSFETPEETEL